MDLEQQLASFDVPPTQGTISKPMSASEPTEIVEEAPEQTNDEQPISSEELEAELETEPGESEESTNEVEETEEEFSPEFSDQFKEAFGVDVNEAREVIDDLQNFKSEMILMREWSVTPYEYDSRMVKVKEFFNSLPEDGREKFNSPEGAKAIWNHISKNNESKVKTPKRKRGTLGKSQTTANSPELIKRSHILKMSDSDYQANYRKISKAFAENRVIEDV